MSLFCAPASQIWTKPLCVPTATRPLCQTTIQHQYLISITNNTYSTQLRCEPELGLVNQSIETELLFLHKAIGFGMITVCEQYMPPEYCGNFRDVQYDVIFGHCIQVSVKHLLFQTRTLMWQNPHQMRDHTTLLPVEERPVSNTWWTVHCKQLVFVQEFPQHKECTTICSGNHLNRDTSQSSNNLRSETAHTVIMCTPLRKSDMLLGL